MLLRYLKRGAYITFFYTMSSVIVRALNFLLLPYFLSRLTLSEFGIWDFYQLFFSTGTLLVTSCASTSLFRFYVLYKDEPLKQTQAVGNSFLFVLFSVLVMVLSGYGIFLCSTSSLFFSDYAFITLCSVSFFALYTIILSLLRVQERLAIYGLVFCGQNFLALAGTLLGVHYKLGIKSFFYANLFSFALFMPWFFILFFNNRFCSFEIFKKQLLFSAPLLIYNLIYMSFFIFDKFFIKNFLGFEQLGLYGILWRFGAVFQMVAIAMIDAWQQIIYNAQKESNADSLISKLITYYALALTTGWVYSIIGALCAISLLFPPAYHYVACYIPLFFMPLFFIEIARLFQTAFGLSTQTLYVPIISCFVLAIQTVLLYCTVGWGIWGIFISNCSAFMVYAFLCFKISGTVYRYQLINGEKMNKIFIFVIFFILIMHCLVHAMPSKIFVAFIIGSTWPGYVWIFDVIEADEKAWVISKLRSLVYFFANKTSVLKKEN